MTPCCLKDGGNVLLWSDGTTSNSARCRTVEDSKQVNNLAARWSVLNRVTPQTQYLAEKSLSTDWIAELVGLGLCVNAVRTCDQRIMVHFPTEVRKLLFSTANRPTSVPTQPSLLVSEYWWLFHWGYSGRDMRLITLLHLMPLFHYA